MVVGGGGGGGRLSSSVVAAVGFWASGRWVNNLVLRLLVRSGGTTYPPGPCRRESGARGCGGGRRECRRWSAWSAWSSRSTRCRRAYLAGGCCRRCRGGVVDVGGMRSPLRAEAVWLGVACHLQQRSSPRLSSQVSRGPSDSECANSVRATVHAASSGANLHLGEPACPAHFFTRLLCILRASLFFVDSSPFCLPITDCRICICSQNIPSFFCRKILRSPHWGQCTLHVPQAATSFIRFLLPAQTHRPSVKCHLAGCSKIAYSCANYSMNPSAPSISGPRHAARFPNSRPRRLAADTCSRQGMM